MSDNTPASNFITVPIARINGAEIRRLRESKGLTQLYMATVIGVTTDTISRWENRRYPTIKLDNAERLAQTLEVDLDTILEQEINDDATLDPLEDTLEGQVPLPPPESPLPLTAPKQYRPALLLRLLLFALLITLSSLFWWKTTPVSLEIAVTSKRILPKHIPLGQTFPVLVIVNTNQQTPVTLILRENLPPGCQVMSAEPPLTSEAAKSGAVKWISRIDQQTSTFVYLVQAPKQETPVDHLQFSGELTVNQENQTQTEITKTTSLDIAPFHWADIDRNNKIDDEEILAVYDRYSSMKKLDFGRDLIDDIWAGNGYLWDKKSGKYVVQE